MTIKNKKSKLAASFVVTTIGTAAVVAAAGASTAACKKTGIGGGDDKDSVNVYRGGDFQGGACFMSYNVSCPKGATCNPPPPQLIDCPPTLRDAAVDPPVSNRRPVGKEDWIRVTPQVWVQPKDECIYQPEHFCPPPKKNGTCTESPKQVKVACKPITEGDAGVPVRTLGKPTATVSEFQYVDGLGECRKVPESQCLYNAYGGCTVPDGEVVTCAK